MKKPRKADLLIILDIDKNSVSQETIDFMHENGEVYPRVGDQNEAMYIIFDDFNKNPDSKKEPIKSELAAIGELIEIHAADYIRFV